MAESRVSIENQITSVKREITMRQKVYPNRVARGKMDARWANHEIAAMEAVLVSLQKLAKTEAQQMSLL